MSPPGAPGADALVFRYAPLGGGGKPVVPIRVSTSVRSVLLVATIAPSLPRTVISPVWAAAIDFSPGGTAVVQVVRDFDLAAEAWGPEIIVRPQLGPELDEAWLMSEEEDGEADWRELDACLLGHDYLRNVSAVLIGQRGLVALFDIEPQQ